MVFSKIIIKLIIANINARLPYVEYYMHDFIYPLVDIIIIPMLDMRKQRPRDLPKVLKLLSGEARI